MYNYLKSHTYSTIPSVYRELHNALITAEKTNKITDWKKLEILARDFRERKLEIFAKRSGERARKEILRSRGKI